MIDNKLKKLEDEQMFESDVNNIPPSDIVAFNELRSCADLLRLHSSGQLNIQPDFQRDIVWSTPDQTRFIDSLTKQLPIPSLCISYDYKTDKRLVIDGLQRLNSIINFLSDDEWKLSKLEDIDQRLAGKTVYTIKTREKELFERVQNVVIPITVIRCDYSKEEHNQYLFTIFHRLNSGGVRLNNQEIRNCIYNGSFNKLLKELANSEETIRLFKKKKRFANEEMILRFFTFYYNLDDYNGSLAKFLNDMMFEKIDLDENEAESMKELYLRTVNFIYEKIFDHYSSSNFGKTFLEGLLIGVAKNLDYLKNKENEEIKMLFNNFRNLPEYSIDSLKEGLSNKDKVKNRICASINCFS